MVAISPEEVDAMRKGRRRIEEMSEFDRELCGADKHRRLLIPMGDVYNFRRIAAVLNRLAADLDALSRRHDIKARSIVFEAQAHIRDANQEIREIRTGRKRPWLKENDDD